jgi:phosphoribosyl-dephospho-CoA transferase
MTPELAPTVHSLLRVVAVELLQFEAAPSPWMPAPWIMPSLQRAPFVVVRRAPRRPGLIPVGVRGLSRSERAAAWLPESALDECKTPQMLAAAHVWRALSNRIRTPAIAMLDAVDAIFAAQGFMGLWGPTGSVGFELASGAPTTHLESDLDLVLDATAVMARTDAVRLHQCLSALPIRIDLQLETPQGAVLLAELASGKGVTLLRSVHGPRLVSDPWSRGVSESRH